MAAAAENAVVRIPMAAPRLPGGTKSPTIAMTVVPANPPASPLKPRAQSSCVGVRAQAHASDATQNAP